MIRFFVSRPVATTVLTALIVLFGCLNLNKLPVREYPNVEAPSISISTTYAGASSNIVETKITQSLENAVAGIEGLDSIRSTSEEGRSKIQLEFSIDRDIDAAANDVRDRINKALNKLPDGADIPVVQKYDFNETPVMTIAVTNPNMTKIELSDYIDRHIADKFSALNGVASVDLRGDRRQSMRIWLNRKEMASHGIAVEDVENALISENVEYPAGRIESKEMEFPIVVSRQYNSVEDFKRLIVLKDENGNFVRISNIARVGIEPKDQRSSFDVNKKQAIALMIYKQSTANTVAISKSVRKSIESMKSKLPHGMKLKILGDEAEFIEQSIAEVLEAMLISAVLVFSIVFVFIGSFKAALIPTITVPISIVGTCIVLNLLNYSLNMLTLLAMVLAVGIVVDDAILTLENVQRRIDEGETPSAAAINGTNQVLFAIISTTAALLAAFLPVGMFPGKTGRLFGEFSVALSSAVCFSALVSLTLTPMLCGRFLSIQKRSKFHKEVDSVVSNAKKFYGDFLETLFSRKSFVSVLFLSILGITLLIVRNIPGEYEPPEDRNIIRIKIEAREGAGRYAMADYMDAVWKKVSPLLEQKSARSIAASVPEFKKSEGAANSGIMVVELKKQKDRSKSAFQIASDLRAELAKIPGIKARPFLPFGIGAKGSNALHLSLAGDDYDELAKWKDVIFEEAKKYPGILDLDCDYKENTPKLRVDIDKERAGDLGVSAKTIGSTLEAALGSKSVTTFVDRGQEYEVILQADRKNRDNIKDISDLYVRSSSALIPLDNIVTVKQLGEAGKLGRQNRSRAISISGNIAEGYSLSDAVEFLEKTVREKLPERAQIYYRGQTKDYKESESGMIFVFFLATLISYFILAAQFESFISPFVVMLTVPLGVFGAVVALQLFGYTMNIYTQIGLIMLIGLSAKHGILIVEFANQLRKEGMELEKAVLEAAKLRLRPIAMIGISTVAGALPLLLATGAGSAARQNLGVVQVFGGISGILLTLIVIPIGYRLIRWRNH